MILKKGEFMPGYTDEHARAGIDAPLPKIECFENQFKDYEITISIPEYTSICPKSGLPDFGTITIRYVPNKLCVELKSLKMYILAYRNLGIFYENSVNRILRDFVKASKPIRAVVIGEFNVRGGMKSTIEASYPSKLTSGRKKQR
jgi:7-cyano-7-deazaguanine reductase